MFKKVKSWIDIWSVQLFFRTFAKKNKKNDCFIHYNIINKCLPTYS